MPDADALSYWWRMIRWPLVFGLVIAIAISAVDGDEAAARWLFFDTATLQWRGSQLWLANGLIHSGGGWLVRCVALLCAALWAATFVFERCMHWRRPAGYFLLATLASVGIIGLLKHLTNVDCPWDLMDFGGRFPHVGLFADRPDTLRAAHCFPAAHAGSGYALMALYFLGIERSTRWARAGLAVGIATGAVFGVAQQARGAHFLSHDLTSALIAWSCALTAYCLLGCRLWNGADSRSSVRRTRVDQWTATDQ